MNNALYRETENIKTDRSNYSNHKLLNYKGINTREFAVHENYEWNNDVSKIIVKEKSKKTYDLINNLQMITNRNLEISTQNDIFKSL